MTGKAVTCYRLRLVQRPRTLEAKAQAARAMARVRLQIDRRRVDADEVRPVKHGPAALDPAQVAHRPRHLLHLALPCVEKEPPLLAAQQAVEDIRLVVVHLCVGEGTVGRRLGPLLPFPPRMREGSPPVL